MTRPGILLDADALAGLDAMLTEANQTRENARLAARETAHIDDWEEYERRNGIVTGIEQVRQFIRAHGSEIPAAEPVLTYSLTPWDDKIPGPSLYREKRDVDGFAVARVSLIRVHLDPGRYHVVGRRKSNGWKRETIERSRSESVAKASATEWLEKGAVR